MGLVHRWRRRSVCDWRRPLTIAASLLVYTFQLANNHVFGWDISSLFEIPSGDKRAEGFDKAVKSITVRGSAAVNGCVRATLEARDCILSAACESLPPLPSSRPRPHLSWWSPGYHIEPPLALRRIMRRSMPVSHWQSIDGILLYSRTRYHYLGDSVKDLDTHKRTHFTDTTANNNNIKIINSLKNPTR